MRCRWENLRIAAAWLHDDDPDKQLIAALGVVAGQLVKRYNSDNVEVLVHAKRYDPADGSDPGNAEVLAPPAPEFRRREGTKVPGGRLYVAYEREPGQEATLRFLFARSGTVTTYSATVTASSLGLYICSCCAGRSRLLMQAMEVAIVDSKKSSNLRIRLEKGGLIIRLIVGDSPEIDFRIGLAKQRPAGTVGYSRRAALGGPPRPRLYHHARYSKEASKRLRKTKKQALHGRMVVW